MTEPYVEADASTEAIKKLLVIAVIGWNSALLPEGRREESVNEFLESLNLPIPTRNEFRLVVELFIQRKLQQFPEVNRMIVNYEIVDMGDTYHLSVASTIPKATL